MCITVGPITVRISGVTHCLQSVYLANPSTVATLAPFIQTDALFCASHICPLEPFVQICLCSLCVQDLPIIVGDDYDEGPIKDIDDAEGVPCPEDTIPANPPLTDSGVLAAAAVDSSSCAVCEKRKMTHWLACTCGARCHLECLAQHFIEVQSWALLTLP